MIAMLLGSVPLFARAQSSAELEVSVKPVSRTIEDEPKETHVVIIELELINRGTSPLYIGVCCWKDRPLQLHNPGVEQLLNDGKWSYVGGAYQDLPAPIWKRLEPGGKFQGEIRIIDPYRKLSVPGGFDMQPRYSLPIRGKHRVRIIYSHARPIYPQDAKERPRNTFLTAYSAPFDIPSKAKENSSSPPQQEEQQQPETDAVSGKSGSIHTIKNAV